MLWLAIACVLGQGMVCVVILRHTETIGQFTESNDRHTQAMLAQQHYEIEIHRENRRMMTELVAFRDQHGTAEQHVANFVEIPPSEERSA